MTNKRVKLEKLFVAKSEARDRFADGIKRLYPIGARVRWVRGGHCQQGEVMKHGYDGDLFVFNLKTWRDLRISAYDVLQAERSRHQESSK